MGSIRLYDKRVLTGCNFSRGGAPLPGEPALARVAEAKSALSDNTADFVVNFSLQTPLSSMKSFFCARFFERLVR